MVNRKKLKDGATLFCQISEEQHQALRTLAFRKRQSIAAIVREALDLYLSQKANKLKRAIPSIK